MSDLRLDVARELGYRWFHGRWKGWRYNSLMKPEDVDLGCADEGRNEDLPTRIDDLPDWPSDPGAVARDVLPALKDRGIMLNILIGMGETIIDAYAPAPSGRIIATERAAEWHRAACAILCRVRKEG